MLKDENGIIELNGQKINYSFKRDYFNGSNVPHLEFRSENANPISKTGYRSWFMSVNPDEFNSVKELIEWFLIGEGIRKKQENLQKWF